MNELRLPWLELAVLIPLAGAALVARQRSSDLARQWCLALAALTFACTLGAWIDYAWLGQAPTRGWGAFPWPNGWHSYLAIDELSAPLTALTALLYFVTALATPRTKVRRFSFAWTLVSLAVVLATLSCREPWGIIALLAAATVPPYLELRARGKPTRVYVLHMGLFVGLMLLGWMVVEFEGRAAAHSLWAVVPLLVAVLIRSGIVPFHCWVADLFEHATFGSALLYVAPLMGGYAAVRLVLPIAPDWVLQNSGLWFLFAAVYAAGMALVQREARRFFSYVFLSNSALVLVGLVALNPLGLTGALCLWLSVGLSLAGFGLALRALEARHGQLSLALFHGLYDHTPILANLFLFMGLATVGFPGTLGFPGAELLVQGVVRTYPLAGMAVVVAVALNGIAVLKVYFKLFTGKRHVTSVPLQSPWRERIAMLCLTALILGGGLHPQPIVLSRHEAATRVLGERQRLGTPAATSVHEVTDAATD